LVRALRSHRRGRGFESLSGHFTPNILELCFCCIILVKSRTIKNIFFVLIIMAASLLASHNLFSPATISILKGGSVVEILQTIRNLAGILAFTFICIQIIVHFFLKYLVKFFGKWIAEFYKLFPLVIVVFVFLHSLIIVFINYKIKGFFDPFYVYTDICILCKNTAEIINTLGRMSFWLVLFLVGLVSFSLEKQLKKSFVVVSVLTCLVFLFALMHLFLITGALK
jgi:hypothetical protein